MMVFDTEFEDYIDSEFTYDPETGFVWWVKGGSNSRKTDKPAGWNHKSGYLSVGLCLSGRRKTVLVHRLAWRIFYGEWPRGFLDHVNGDKKDNRIVNLREASATQNTWNASVRVDNPLQVKGVTKTREGGYRARIQCRGKRHNLGTFESLEGAKNAYEEASRDMHGEFSNVCVR